MLELLSLLAALEGPAEPGAGGATVLAPVAETVAPATNPATTPNHPPAFVRLWPDRFNAAEVSVKVGKRLEVGLEVTDRDGDPLAVQVFGLPVGARFSEPLRALHWTPTGAQRGEHLLRFVVSDGRLETSRMLRILVTDNRAPQFSLEVHPVRVGEFAAPRLAAIDPDGDTVTYTIRGAPPGSVFDPNTGTLRWLPTEDDLGPHEVQVTASDGEAQTTTPMRLQVELSTIEARRRSEWTSYLLPGAGYALYVPRARETLGTFQGVSLEVLIAAWIHRNENRGPSHGRIYLSAEILNSSEDAVPILFSYAFGFSLSLERNPQRKFLIPNYGVDVGQVIQDDIGSRFQSTPYLGLHLFSDPNLFVSARLGYRLVPSELERLGGMHFGANLDFSVW